MKKPRLSLVISLIVGLVFAVSAWKAQTQEVLDATIQISPQVLNVASQGQWITVHTDIAYSTVDVATVFLENDSGYQVPLSWSKADGLGRLVAKFSRADVIAMDGLETGANELTLVGSTTAGATFAGTDEIRVIHIAKHQRP